MKTANAALIALIGTGSFVSVDLYSIFLSDGSVLRYATSDVDISMATDVFDVYQIPDIFEPADIFTSYLWTTRGPRIDDPEGRARGRWRVGLDVDTWQARILPRARAPVTGENFPDKIGTTSWLAAAAGGALDGADVLVERAFLFEWPTPWRTPVVIDTPSKITMFFGRMADVDVSRTYAVLNVNDFRELLNMQMPRNLYQSGCRFTLFGAGCSLSAATYAVAGTVVSVDGNAIVAVLGFAAGYFNLGRITMTSGKNTGFTRVVRSWDGVTVKMIAPFYFDVAPGDTFNIYPGCDKSMATCAGKFSNANNFGGEPFIPAPEAAV